MRGGQSRETEESLRTGAFVLQNLANDERYEAHDILVDRDGIWHLRGAPVSPMALAEKVDVIFNALHGHYGEDGKVQSLLSGAKIPFTGSTSTGSAMSLNKVLAKEAIRHAGLSLSLPVHTLIEPKGDPEKVSVYLWRNFPQPSVLKPLHGGSGKGVSLIESFSSLLNALRDFFKKGERMILEHFVFGREATVGVIDNFRKQNSYVLFPVEVELLNKRGIFDKDARLDTKTRFHAPGRFTEKEKGLLIEAARAVHEALHLRDYSRSDFLLTPKGVYFLEANSVPKLAEDSLFLRGLDAAAIPFKQFLDHTLLRAYERAGN